MRFSASTAFPVETGVHLLAPARCQDKPDNRSAVRIGRQDLLAPVPVASMVTQDQDLHVFGNGLHPVDADQLERATRQTVEERQGHAIILAGASWPVKPGGGVIAPFRTVTGPVSLPVDWCVGANQAADRDVAPFRINRRHDRPGWGATPAPRADVKPDWGFRSMCAFAAAVEVEFGVLIQESSTAVSRSCRCSSDPAAYPELLSRCGFSAAAQIVSQLTSWPPLQDSAFSPRPRSGRRGHLAKPRTLPGRTLLSASHARVPA